MDFSNKPGGFDNQRRSKRYHHLPPLMFFVSLCFVSIHCVVVDGDLWGIMVLTMHHTCRMFRVSSPRREPAGGIESGARPGAAPDQVLVPEPLHPDDGMNDVSRSEKMI
jgi:hypothetical protein